MRDEEDYGEDSELGGPRTVYEQRKGDGSTAKIIWTWACAVTGLLVIIAGFVFSDYVHEQALTNRSVAEALGALAVKVAGLEAKVEQCRQ